MRSFIQFLGETRGRGTNPTKTKHYNNHDEWKRDAHKLGYRVHQHNDHSKAEKKEKGDAPGIPYYNRSRGHFWHKGGFGILRYKYMPEAIDIKQPIKAKSSAAIKTAIKPYKANPQMAKPQQSNVKNQIDALAGQPTGVPSGIPTGNHV